MKAQKTIGRLLFLFLIIWFLFPVVSMAEEMRRIDCDGYLYYMDYTDDYYSSEVIASLNADQICWYTRN